MESTTESCNLKLGSWFERIVPFDPSGGWFEVCTRISSISFDNLTANLNWIGVKFRRGKFEHPKDYIIDKFWRRKNMTKISLEGLRESCNSSGVWYMHCAPGYIIYNYIYRTLILKKKKHDQNISGSSSKVWNICIVHPDMHRIFSSSFDNPFRFKLNRCKI